MLNLLLTRHGLVEPDDVMLGAHLDLPLAPEGRRQARALARRLAGLPLDRIVASPMRRALETARTVAAGRPVETDRRLVEIDYGAWEGLTYAQMEARDPALRDAWEQDPAAVRPPGGETAAEVAARCRSFLDDQLAWAEQSAGPDGPPCLLVAAHGSLNRILLCVALGVPPTDYRRRFTQDRANLTILRYGRDATADRARLILLNDVGHLRRPGEPRWSRTMAMLQASSTHDDWHPDPSGHE